MQQQYIVDGKLVKHIPCDGRCTRHATHILKVQVMGHEEARHYCSFCYSIVAPQVARIEETQEKEFVEVK